MTTLPQKIKNIILRRIAKRNHIKLSPEVLEDNDQLFAALDEHLLIPHYAREAYGPEPIAPEPIEIKEVILREEIISCPKCGMHQNAKVKYQNHDLFPTFVHECVNCKYVILESEWEVVKQCNYKKNQCSYTVDNDNYKQSQCSYIDDFRVTTKKIRGIKRFSLQKRDKNTRNIITLYLGKIFAPDRAREKIKKYLINNLS